MDCKNRIRILKEIYKYPFIRMPYHSTFLYNLWYKVKNQKIKNFIYNIRMFIEKHFYTLSYTSIEGMGGWHDLLIEMCEEIKKTDYKGSCIYYVKEKWGRLCIFANATKEIFNIIRKYENKSVDICLHCGKETKYITTGYILYLCPECAKESHQIYVLKDKLDDFYDECDASEEAPIKIAKKYV